MKVKKPEYKAKVQRSDTPPPSPQTQEKPDSIYKVSPESETYCLITGIAHIPFTGWFISTRQSYIGLMDGADVIGSMRIGMDHLDIFVNGAPEALTPQPPSLER
jgi:hypothetical protein